MLLLSLIPSRVVLWNRFALSLLPNSSLNARSRPFPATLLEFSSLTCFCHRETVAESFSHVTSRLCPLDIDGNLLLARYFSLPTSPHCSSALKSFQSPLNATGFDFCRLLHTPNGTNQLSCILRCRKTSFAQLPVTSTIFSFAPSESPRICIEIR
jgi:hypothetical protein